VALFRNGRQQGPLDFAAGDILGVENATPGMAALLAEIQFAAAAGIGLLAFREMHPQLD